MNIATVMRDAILATARPEGVEILVQTSLPQAHRIDGVYSARATVINRRGEVMSFEAALTQREAILAETAEEITRVVNERVAAVDMLAFMDREREDDAA